MSERGQHKRRRSPARGGDTRGAFAKFGDFVLQSGKAFVAIGTFVLVAVGCWFAYLRLDAPVAEVLIAGDLNLNQQNAIGELLRPHVGTGILSLDLVAIHADLGELSWVRRAGVRRRWPDAVVVDVEPALPIARWGEDALLGQDGQIFGSRQMNAEATGDLPLLVGPNLQARNVLIYFQALSAIAREHGYSLAALTLDEFGGWQFELKGGPVVLLGAVDPVARARRVLALYRFQLVPEGAEIARIDGRYPDAVAVRYADQPAALSESVGTVDGLVESERQIGGAR